MRSPANLLSLATLFLLGAIAVNSRAEYLYVPSQFATIHAALAQARTDRLSLTFSPNETIVIHVSPGRYVEEWPLILDVPNLRLEGDTSLTVDASGLPTGFVDSTETRLVAKPPLAGVQTILLLGPTSADLTGADVTVQGLVLDAGNGGTAVDGRDITIDRASGFSVLRNVLTGSALMGVDARASRGSIEGNFVSGLGCGSCLSAGNQDTPARYSFLRNRAIDNVYQGVLVAGSSYDGVQDPALLSTAPGTIFDSVTAVIDGNDLSDNNHAPDLSYGVRLFAIIPGIPTAQSTGNLQVSVTNNTILNNSIGVSIEAGFAYRSDPRLWGANFHATFSGNAIVGSKGTAALMTFTSEYASIFPNELKKDYKYLEDSTIAISDPERDLAGYWFDNQAADPIDGRSLNNALTVNGITIPSGRNFH
jgi:hypothetical protein